MTLKKSAKPFAKSSLACVGDSDGSERADGRLYIRRGLLGRGAVSPAAAASAIAAAAAALDMDWLRERLGDTVGDLEVTQPCGGLTGLTAESPGRPELRNLLLGGVCGVAGPAGARRLVSSEGLNMADEEMLGLELLRVRWRVLVAAAMSASLLSLPRLPDEGNWVQVKPLTGVMSRSDATAAAACASACSGMLSKLGPRGKLSLDCLRGKLSNEDLRSNEDLHCCCCGPPYTLAMALSNADWMLPSGELPSIQSCRLGCLIAEELCKPMLPALPNEPPQSLSEGSLSPILSRELPLSGGLPSDELRALGELARW